MRCVLKELRQLRLFIGLSLLVTAIVPFSMPANAAVVAAAGDIVCDPADPNYSGNNTGTCQFRATANLITSLSVAQVFALGDNQYNDGSLEDFRFAYDPTWGVFKGITRPVPGNAEYGTPNAQGYFNYFGDVADGPDDQGYYSFNLGNWHIVALNSNCGQVAGGCAAGSPQEVWLKNDLAADTHQCTLAFDHHPRFSSSGSSSAISALVRDLYNDRAEVLLSGHRHNYERFRPQTPSGAANTNGIVQFVVGTGGRSLTGFGTILPGSRARLRAFGVLRLALNSGGYNWNFRRISGGSFDSGSATCR
jgi:acid phosphatase type 7